MIGLLPFTFSLSRTLSFHYMAGFCSLLHYSVVDAHVSANINIRTLNNTSDFDSESFTQLQKCHAVCCLVAFQVDSTHKVSCQTDCEIHGSRLLPTASFQ